MLFELYMAGQKSLSFPIFVLYHHLEKTNGFQTLKIICQKAMSSLVLCYIAPIVKDSTRLGLCQCNALVREGQKWDCLKYTQN